MSKKEFDRLEVLLGVQSGRLRVADACELLSLKRRQVFRLLAGLKHGGAASLVSKRRGRRSNNRLPEAYRDLALSLVRERYADFGPSLAAEKLAADGRFAVRHEGVALPFRVFDKIQTVASGAIVENKRLGAALAFARELQASYPPNRRRGDPRRHRPPNNLETPCMPTKGRPSRKVLAAAAAK